MALLSGGIKRSQKEIAREVCDENGTAEKLVLSYLARFYRKIGFKANAKVSDIESHLKEGHLLIADWWDDFDPGDVSGHYSLILDYDKKKGTLKLADPSSGRGIWHIKVKDFVSKWFDKEDDYDGWLLWLDPHLRV